MALLHGCLCPMRVVRVDPLSPTGSDIGGRMRFVPADGACASSPRERGAQPTAIADVLEHSGAPRGSAYHYFPGGRTQLLCEAIDYSGEYVAAKIDDAETGLDALDGLIEYYRMQLQRSDYRAGCPVVAVTVEAGDPAKPEQSTPTPVSRIHRWISTCRSPGARSISCWLAVIAWRRMA